MSVQATQNMASGSNDLRNSPYGYFQEINDLEAVLGVRQLCYYDLGCDQDGIWRARVGAIYDTNGFACIGNGPTQAAAKEHATRQVLALTPWCPHSSCACDDRTSTPKSDAKEANIDIEALIKENEELRAKNAKLEKSEQTLSAMVDDFMVKNTEQDIAYHNKIKALQDRNLELQQALQDCSRDNEKEKKSLREELNNLNKRHQHQIRNDEGNRFAIKQNLLDIKQKEEIIERLQRESTSRDVRISQLEAELVAEEEEVQSLEEKVSDLIEYDEERTRKARDNWSATKQVLNDMSRAIKRLEQEVNGQNGLTKIMSEELEGAKELISTLKHKNKVLEDEYQKATSDAEKFRRELDDLRLSDEGELYRRIHVMEQELHARNELREKDVNEHTRKEERLQRQLKQEKDRNEYLEEVIDDKHRIITELSGENRRLQQTGGIRMVRLRPRRVVIGEDHDLYDLQRLASQVLAF